MEASAPTEAAGPYDRLKAVLEEGGCDGAAAEAMKMMEGPGGAPVPPAMLTAHGSCGKALRRGDLMVICKTCQADASCCVCLDCFDKSKHVGHNWRIQTSNGGVCDCGDESAWDPKGFCEKHRGVAADADPLDGIPAGIVAGCTGVVTAVLRLMVEEIESGDADGAAAGWVQGCLLPFANLSGATCRVVTNALMAKVDTVEYNVSPHAVILRRTAASGEDRPYTRRARAQLRAACDRLYHRLFIDFRARTCFALHFTRSLAEHVKLPWAVNQSVQFLTVPTVLRALLPPDPAAAYPGILHAFTAAVHEKVAALCSPMARAAGLPAGKVISVEGISSCMKVDLLSAAWAGNETEKLLLRRVATVFGQCVRQPGFSWPVLADAALRDRVLMHLLAVQQGAGCRRLDDDTDTVEYLRYEVSVLSPAFTDVLPQGVADAAPRAAAAFFDAAMRFMRAYTASLFPHGADAATPWAFCNDPFGNPDHSVTFQLPLHRFFAQALHRVLLVRRVAACGEVMDVDAFIDPAAGCVEPVVALFAARGQVRAGMWRRNHMRIAEQAVYHTALLRSDAAARDVFFLQWAAAAAGPTAVALHLARRFSESHPLLPRDEAAWRGAGGAPPEHDLLPEYLAVIMQVACDRSKLTASEVVLLRDRVVQRLATGAAKFSALAEAVQREREGGALGARELQDVLAEVADAAPRNDGMVYSLKKEAWQTVSPYDLKWQSWHLVEAEAEHARVVHGRAGDGATLPLRCPVPRAADAPALRPVIGLLHTDVVLGAAVGAVRRAVGRAEGGADAALRVALDALLLALSTEAEFREAYPLVEARERAWAERCHGVQAAEELCPSGWAWLGIAVPVADRLAAAPPAGPHPLLSLVALAGLPAYRELRPVVQDILARAREASPAAASFLHAARGGGGHGGGAPDADDAARSAVSKRKAKGKSRQAAALQKLQRQQEALAFDMDSDGGGEAGPAAAPAAAAASAAHMYMDSGYLDENDTCCICMMDVAPGGSSELALVSLCTRGKGYATTCRPVLCTPEAPPPRGTGGALDARLTPFAITHTCGHLVHPECLRKNVAARPGARYGVHPLAAQEFLCPLCRRLGNALVPLVAPEGAAGDAKGKMWRQPYVPLLCTTPEASGLDLSRDEAGVEDGLRHARPLAAPTADLRARVDMAAFYFPAVVEAAQEAEGGLSMAWAQAVAAAELETRVADVRTVSARKLVFLRSQLKVILAHGDSGDAADGRAALEALLGGAPAAGALRDAFGTWTRAVVGVALRDEVVGHAGLRWLTRRALEVHLAALVFAVRECGAAAPEGAAAPIAHMWEVCQPAAAAAASPALSEGFNVLPYLQRELAVFATRLAVACGAILARVGGGGALPQVGMALPELAPGGRSAAAVLEEAGALLHAVAGVGVEYGALEYIAAAAFPRACGWAARGLLRGAPPPHESHHPPCFIDLPQDFHEVASKWPRKVACAACGEVPQEAALCLTCGQLLCVGSGHPPACVKAAAEKHSETCGGGHAVYLLPRTSQLLACSATRAYPLAPFYVDANGEADPDLRRGWPLFLSVSRVRRTLQMAASHLYAYDSSALERAHRLRPQD